MQGPMAQLQILPALTHQKTVKSKLRTSNGNSASHTCKDTCMCIYARGVKKNRFFHFSLFSLERFCLDSEKFIIDFLIKKKKNTFFFFFFYTFSFCFEMTLSIIMSLFI